MGASRRALPESNSRIRGWIDSWLRRRAKRQPRGRRSRGEHFGPGRAAWCSSRVGCATKWCRTAPMPNGSASASTTTGSSPGVAADVLGVNSPAMTTPTSDATMAVFLDLENIALGARDAKYPSFDIEKVLERLLLKGHIVVKKAYCDFDRYKDFKRGLHEAAFELIEIPHVRQSGKNSADIRMVVDALDLCYTKGHVDTFVILSGDSDFSPLVSKLRENAKTVIGVGVKNSNSDLIINNCDEFIYYDDLVRKEPSKARRRSPAPARSPAVSSETPAAELPAAEAAANENKGPDLNDALELIVETLEALAEERGGSEPIWGSMIKQAIKRRHPGFNERAYGFRSFNDLLADGEKRGLLTLRADEKSGGYTVRVADRPQARVV